MKVTFSYASLNPSCSSLIVTEQGARIGTLNEDAMIDLLTDSQWSKWENGCDTFSLTETKLRGKMKDLRGIAA